MNIGQRLKEARLAAGLSQRQLCGDTITRNMLSQIENGVARPSMDTLQTLAKRLDKPVSFFLEEQKDEGVEPLLNALRCLEQAEQAVAEGRLPYTVSLLEDCAVAAEQTPYFLPVLERRRQLLLAKALPEEAEDILATLQPEDTELLLRVQVALGRHDGAQAEVLLHAAQEQNSNEWNMLSGQAAFLQEQYAKAAEYFHKAELGGDARADGWLEQCYRQLENYKMAYYYACKQK